MQLIMKVKFLGPEIFLPENKNGVNKTTYNLLKDHPELAVEFYYPATFGDKKTPELPPGFSHVTLRPIRVSRLRQINFFSKLSSLLSLRPFIADRQSQLRLLAAGLNLDSTTPLVVVSLTSAGVLDFLKPEQLRHTALMPIDCLTFFYESRIENEPSFFKRLLYRLDAWKARRFEKSLYARACKSLFVSPHDAARAREISGGTCLGLPYGVDLDKFDRESGAASLKSPTESHDLIFTGNFDYGPNIMGALFLTDQVMPLLRARGVDVRLILAGGNPVPAIRERACSDIMVTGFVDSLTPLLKSSTVFLSPIFFGAGVKTKVLEAMYLECLILGTPESFWAIEAKLGEDVLVVEDKRNPEAWARFIQEIVENEEKYRDVGARARAAIVANHRWPRVRELYREQIVGLL